MAGVVVVDLTAKDNVSPALDKIQSGAKSLNGRLNTLQGTLARIGTAALVKGFVSAGIEADRTGKRLKLLSGSYNETAKLQDLASTAAKKFSIGTTAAASAATDLYGRLRPMGISLKDIGTVFNGVNVAASKMNLSTADTEGVMLQLSQALGSGTLQGDEFRSIMERLPAIGQAVADSMGVEVSALKKLSSEGQITTAKIIKALQGLAGQDPPQADAYKKFNKAMADLSTTIGTQLLPAVTPFVQVLGGLISAFSQLPGPVQTLVAGVVGLGAAFVVLAPAVAAVGPAFAAISTLKIGAILTGLVPVVTGLGSALSGLLPIIAGVFTGPVGWAALLVGAGVAIYAFRDQISEALAPVGKLFSRAFSAIRSGLLTPVRKAFASASQFIYDKFVAPFAPQINEIVTNAQAAFGRIYEIVTTPYRQAWEFILDFFIDPVQAGISSLVAGIADSFEAVYEALVSPFRRAFDFIKDIVNGILNKVNDALAAIAKLGTGGGSGGGQSKPMAEGGYVNRPTNALIGERGENEYVIPESKMNSALKRYARGSRGESVVEGGSEQSSGARKRPGAVVNISTGPVMQMDGQDYVTVSDLNDAVGNVAMAMSSGDSGSYGSNTRLS